MEWARYSDFQVQIWKIKLKQCRFYFFLMSLYRGILSLRDCVYGWNLFTDTMYIQFWYIRRCQHWKKGWYWKKGWHSIEWHSTTLYYLYIRWNWHEFVLARVPFVQIFVGFTFFLCLKIWFFNFFYISLHWNKQLTYESLWSFSMTKELQFLEIINLIN